MFQGPHSIVVSLAGAYPHCFSLGAVFLRHHRPCQLNSTSWHRHWFLGLPWVLWLHFALGSWGWNYGWGSGPLPASLCILPIDLCFSGFPDDLFCFMISSILPPSRTNLSFVVLTLLIREEKLLNHSLTLEANSNKVQRKNKANKNSTQILEKGNCQFKRKQHGLDTKTQRIGKLQSLSWIG